MSSTLEPTTLVGRDAERARLSAALAASRVGRGGIWLLTGEPGIGKTRLAEACEVEACEAGFTCAWGRAWESGGAPGFWPWAQVLRTLERATGSGGDPRWAALRAALLPERTVREEAPGSRFELFAALEAYLSEAAGARPLWVCLEDLHAADPASLALLEALLEPLKSAPVLVLATVRDAAFHLGPHADTHLRIARQANVLPLGRLDVAAARALLACELDDTTAALALEATGGHPLFLVELRRLISQAPPSSAPGALIPASLQIVFSRRLAGLCAPSRALLARAALLGMELDRDLLGALEGAGALETALAEAEAAALLNSRGRAPRFSHALLREALAASMSPADREAAHAAIAARLATRGAPAAVRAHHLHQAGTAHAQEAAEVDLEAAQDPLRASPTRTR